MSTPAALQQATTVAQSAAELAKAPWDQLDTNDLPEAAAAITQARTYLDAALLALTHQLETTHAAERLGWASTKDFLTHLTGGHKGTGGGLVRAVEQLADLPTVRDALERGAVSLPQARAIATKISTLPRNPGFRTAAADKLLDLATTRALDATDLTNAFADVVRQLDPDGTIINTDLARKRQERGAHTARHLSFTPDRLGGVQVRGYGTIEDAERIKTVLLPLAAPLTTEPGSCGGRRSGDDEPLIDSNGHFTGVACPTPVCAHDGRDPRDHGTRMWDALVDACDQLRATDTLPRDHGTIPRILVTIDHDSLRQQVIDAGHAHDGQLPSDQRLSAHATRRLACDAELIPAVLGSQSQILDVGRTRRLVTPAIWLALVLRDRHCAFPGCTRLPLACDAHHITHWADGGATSLDNLLLLCRHHHTLVHQTPWTIHIAPDTGQPVWTPPPKTDVRDRITHVPPQRRHPLVA